MIVIILKKISVSRKAIKLHVHSLFFKGHTRILKQIWKVVCVESLKLT